MAKEKLKEGNVNAAIEFFQVILLFSIYLCMNFGFILSIYILD